MFERQRLYIENWRYSNQRKKRVVLAYYDISVTSSIINEELFNQNLPLHALESATTAAKSATHFVVVRGKHTVLHVALECVGLFFITCNTNRLIIHHTTTTPSLF